MSAIKLQEGPSSFFYFPLKQTANTVLGRRLSELLKDFHMASV